MNNNDCELELEMLIGSMKKVAIVSDEASVKARVSAFTGFRSIESVMMSEQDFSDDECKSESLGTHSSVSQSDINMSVEITPPAVSPQEYGIMRPVVIKPQSRRHGCEPVAPTLFKFPPLAGLNQDGVLNEINHKRSRAELFQSIDPKSQCHLSGVVKPHTVSPEEGDMMHAVAKKPRARLEDDGSRTIKLEKSQEGNLVQSALLSIR